MIKKRIYNEVAITLIIVAIASLVFYFQQNTIEAYFADTFPSQGITLAQVTLIQTNTNTTPQTKIFSLKLLTGDSKNQTTTITVQALSTSTENTFINPSLGDKVLLARNTLDGPASEQYYITDNYRLPALLFIIFIFVIVAIVFGRLRGLTSLVGLAISAAVLLWFVIPRILAGDDPITTCLMGATAIAVSSLYLAHGFNKRTTVALCGTLITLIIATSLSIFFVFITKLIGISTDYSFYIELGKNITLNLRGILLGGIIIGSLGVLDDVTIGQAAAVYELKNADRTFGVRELYHRGMSIGREHIASLINTLFLAYAGVALPLLLYLAAFQSQIPLWLIANGEPIAEEIVRTMAGSIGIVLAVPITTLIAAWVFGRGGHTSARK